jgi:mannose-6-phosphate isomerase-like protein (cupin superfamily)
MISLFRKIAVAQRFSEPEFNAVCTELKLVVDALRDGHACSPFDVRPSLCALYLYGNSNEVALKEVIGFANSILNNDFANPWSENIMRLSAGIFADLQIGRIGELLEKISDQKSLTTATSSAELKSSLNDVRLTGLYDNKVDELNIDFSVQILPFDLEVLDPRIVRIRPQKANEMHRHAHETVFIFLEGEGKVVVDQFENAVKPGDFAFIPRWCNHQSVNTGDSDLVFLAVADFGLTGKSFVGNYLKTARLKAQ